MENPKRIVRFLPMIGTPLCILCSVMALVFFSLACRLVSTLPSSVKNAHVTVQAPTISAPPIFRDDFSGELNSAWKWENEDASRYTITQDGWLAITGGKESIFSGGQQTNLLWTSLPEDGVVISIHLKSQPLFDLQRAGILLFDDSGQYISLSRGHCTQCVLGGSGVFLEYNLKGDQARYVAATDATDLYLMFIRARGFVSGFYVNEEGKWQSLADIYSEIRFSRVGLSVTNDSKWDEGFDVVGQFDFFEIRPSYHQNPSPPWMAPEVIVFR